MDLSHRRSTPAALVIVALTLVAHAAQAQGINRCRIDGRLVLQSAPCPLDPPMHSAATAALAPLATAVSGAPKKKTLAEMLRERDGAQHAPAPLREAQGDGAHVLRARMGAV